MCGIVGIVTKKENGFTYAQQELFSEMLVTDSVRGEDSTGLFSVNKLGNATYLKLATHPFNLIKSNEYKEWKQTQWKDGRILVGHNRKATTGDIINANAHPFAFGHTLLVHNGQVENFRSLLPIKEREKHNVFVDSHAACVLLARNDPRKIIPEMHGAFAFVWYNAKEKQLHFIRNSERPLSFANSEDGIYFASEKGMLSWLLKRRGNQAEITELKPGVLISLSLDDLKWNHEDVKVWEKNAVVSTLPPVHRPQQQSRYLPIEHKQDKGAVVNHVPLKDFKAPEGKEFNIHYGQDEKVVIDPDIPFPQIVWSVTDYKCISDDHVVPPVWKLWGFALDSTRIEVECHVQCDRAEADDLAYADDLIAFIMRVRPTTHDIQNNTWSQKVYVKCPKEVKMTVTPNGKPITVDHWNDMTHKQKCECGQETSDIETKEIHCMRDGFKNCAKCSWCCDAEAVIAEATVEPKKGT